MPLETPGHVGIGSVTAAIQPVKAIQILTNDMKAERSRLVFLDSMMWILLEICHPPLPVEVARNADNEDRAAV